MVSNGTALEHVKAHAIGYGFVVGGLILALSWRGTVAFLDARHVLKQEHTRAVEVFTKGQQDILSNYQTTELETQLRIVKKDLKTARRDRRRFEAYITADPGSALATARRQTVQELNDEVSELEEERNELVTKQKSGAF